MVERPRLPSGHAAIYITPDGIVHAALGDQVIDFPLTPAELLALASSFVDAAERLRAAGLWLHDAPTVGSA